jgi:hypothetical protein
MGVRLLFKFGFSSSGQSHLTPSCLLHNRSYVTVVCSLRVDSSYNLYNVTLFLEAVYRLYEHCNKVHRLFSVIYVIFVILTEAKDLLFAPLLQRHPA